MNKQQYICILCCVAILIIMFVSLKGCYRCSSYREGMSSPSEIYQNQDRIKDLKTDACVNKQYDSMNDSVNKLQKRVNAMKKANDSMAAGDAKSDKVASG